MPFENPVGFPVSGDDLKTMVETALSQRGLTVAEPLAADFVVTGVVSDWNLIMSPMIRLPILGALFRAGVMTVTIDLRLLNLDTAEFQADVITESIEGIEIFGLRFGLNPRDLARKAANRIAEKVASLSVITVSKAPSRRRLSNQDSRSMNPLANLTISRQPVGLSFSLPKGLVSEMRVEIYNLAGGKVFDSGRVAGHSLSWNLQNMAGEPVANGVYLYVVTAWTSDGRLRSGVRKLAILR